MKLLDLHIDSATAIWEKGASFARNDGHVDFERAFAYSPYAAFYAFYGDSRVHQMEGRFDRALAALLSSLAGRGRVCTTRRELDLAVSEGLLPVFLSIEGAEMIGCSPEGLEEAHARGVRMSGITWNNPNALSDGGALTGAGVAYVKKCSSLGVILDISHLSDAGVSELFRLTDGPVVASHSNARSLCPHRRNLTDGQIKELVARGGLIGLNLYAPFVSDRPDPPLSMLARHAAHIALLGGEKNLAVGTDFDGCDRFCGGLRGLEDMPLFYDALIAEGFSPASADGICYDNAYAFLGVL